MYDNCFMHLFYAKKQQKHLKGDNYMKKVNRILSSVCDKLATTEFTVAITIALVILTALSCGVYFTVENRVSAETVRNYDSQKMILELSESYLSPNSDTNISVLEAVSESASQENESEEVSVKPEAETEEVTVQKVSETKDQIPGTRMGYTFDQLGLTQVSDIPVPDSVRFDENGIPLEYKQKLSGKSTTYIMGHTTATGTPVHPGVVAVNPRIIPYGSKMYIVANDGSGAVYGYCSAEDTGGFIYMSNGPLVDLYVWTMQDVYAWGNHPVDVYIL
ncbi:MAG: 3D domain-containing protein [Clostridia bacterium]|nr:3D domain-containing protein [Clostridia bacterium]